MSKRKFIVFLLSLITSFSQLIGQDSIPLIIHAWKLNNTDTVSVPVDTTIDNIHTLAMYRNFSASSNLGVNGLPTMSVLAHDYKPFSDYFVLDFNSPYILYPNNFIFYNSTIPVTYLRYNNAKRKSTVSQSLEILHTQNVNKNLNFGLLYNTYSYENKLSQALNFQNASDNNIGLNLNYHSKKYKNHFVFAYNNLRQRENGGMFLDTLRDYDADSKIRLINLEMLHGINLSNINKPDTFVYDKDSMKGAFLYHKVFFSDLKRLFVDIERDKTLYPGTDLLNEGIRDSVLYRKFKNQLILDFNNDRYFPLQSQLYISNEMHSFKSIFQDTSRDLRTDPIYRNYIDSKNFISNSIGGQFQTHVATNAKLLVNAEYWLNSYLQNNYTFEARLNYKFTDSISSPECIVKFNMCRDQVPWLFNHYASSYYTWDRSFNPTKISSTELTLKIPSINLELIGGFKLIDNFLFFNEKSLPDQSVLSNSLYYATVNKKIKLWHFIFINNYTIQQVANELNYRIPTHVLFNSSFFEHNINFFTGGKIFLQTGFDIRYHSAFYANAYNQSLGVFYLQNQKKIADYPMIDAFLKMKIKEAGLFVKIENLMNLIDNRNTYNTPYYLYNEWLLRLGITWIFKY